ncbi:hypothetical protein F8M41_003740 [Gigaspora margarita]|uniref:Uncharacterized protein n=1 Tax=Gigaspora margarita TaxID=4874 RepID=A0A8H3XBK5_GIGMA|nr:hypothetical protein F8M41_003740 [Gigaspora margarita]
MDSDPQERPIANDIYNKLGEWIKCIEDSGKSEIKKQFLCGDDNFIKLFDCFKYLKSFGDWREIIKQFFSDDILIHYKFDEWIKNLENSGDLDETITQFLDNDKYGKESSDDHKYKSKYIQKDSNSLLMPLP